MNIKISDEDFKILEKYADKFTIVKKSNYVRGISKLDSQTIASIVDEKIDGVKRAYNWYCTSCIIGLWKRAANAYFTILEERNKPEPENISTETEDEKPKSKKKQSKKVESKA